MLIGPLAVVGLANVDKFYTATTFLLTAFLLAFHLFHLKTTYLGRFYRPYLVMLLPCFIINGILTGSLIEQAVVWYNDQESLGIGLFTIPIEDVFYSLLLILMNLTLYAALKKTH